MMAEEKGGGVAWLALVIGIIALLLAWSSYNKSGGDLEAEVSQKVREILEEGGQLKVEVASSTVPAAQQPGTTTEATQ